MIKHLVIVGATGAVGRECCTLIAERKLQFGELTLLASVRTAGTVINISGQEHRVKELTPSSFDGVTHAVFSAGGIRSREFAPIAVQSGTTVIDNSSVFRMDSEVPLVIPEINATDAKHHKGIVANPNCSTIIMNMVTWPLHKINPVRRIVVSTYQAASGAGAAAMAELESQTADFLAGRPIQPRVLPHQVAFNLFSHNSPIGDDGYNEEERKMILETRKIFHDPTLAITATCVRVPVLRTHSESINLTFERPINPDEARRILSDSPGVRVVDDIEAGYFPMPIDASGQDDCLVGRIRQDVSQSGGCGLDLFVCGDQLRKGAALNAIQILEALETES